MFGRYSLSVLLFFADVYSPDTTYITAKLCNVLAD